ncbi:unnamed protein product [Dovyalis caffra]|uniref:HMG box domain-containing protein n=1 Tax=Dovyalis caffra TaxID=77055 RepID=A0AAV1QXS8_9ROSI|nr:unnamed protein product [Dovyalis caffra]
MDGGEDSPESLSVNATAVSSSDNAEPSASQTGALCDSLEKGGQKANETEVDESCTTKKRPHNSFIEYYLSKGLDEERENMGKKKLKAPKNVAKQWKSLPQEEKRPFQDAVKDAWKNHAKERGERPEVPKKAYLDSRCSLRKFAAVVKMFDQDQIQAVSTLGLAGLLHIKKQKRKFQVIEDLAARFDIKSCELEVHGGRLKLTPGGVEWLLGLPSSGLSVEQFIGSDEDVRIMYNLGSDRIHAGQLGDSLASIPASPEFQAKFLLYAISTVIRPSTSVYVSPSCFGILKNLSIVCALNWAKYALEGLVSGIKKYRETDFTPSKAKRLTGCLLILEHVNVGQIKLPRASGLAPRIRDWDEDAKSLVFEKVYKLGGMDSDKVELVMRHVSAPSSMPSCGVTVAKNGELTELRKDMAKLRGDVMFYMEKMGADMANFKETVLSAIAGKQVFLLEPSAHTLPSHPNHDSREAEQDVTEIPTEVIPEQTVQTSPGQTPTDLGSHKGKLQGFVSCSGQPCLAAWKDSVDPHSKGSIVSDGAEEKKVDI